MPWQILCAQQLSTISLPVDIEVFPSGNASLRIHSYCPPGGLLALLSAWDPWDNPCPGRRQSGGKPLAGLPGGPASVAGSKTQVWLPVLLPPTSVPSLGSCSLFTQSFGHWSLSHPSALLMSTLPKEPGPRAGQPAVGSAQASLTRSPSPSIGTSHTSSQWARILAFVQYLL